MKEPAPTGENQSMKLSEKDRMNVLMEFYKQAQHCDRHCDTLIVTTGTVFIPLCLGILAFTLTTLNTLTLESLIILGSSSEFFLVFWAIIHYRLCKQQENVIRPKIEMVAKELGVDIVLNPAKSQYQLSVRLLRYIIPTVFGILWGALIYFSI